jgi:hypothetical protein
MTTCVFAMNANKRCVPTVVHHDSIAWNRHMQQQ